VNNVIFPNNYVTLPGVDGLIFEAISFINQKLKPASNGKRKKNRQRRPNHKLKIDITYE
jgi:hypothetical protein